MQTGQKAAIISGELDEYLDSREHMLLAQLVNQHRAGKITETEMRSGIAEISALWAIRSELGRRVRQGHQAQEEVFR